MTTKWFFVHHSWPNWNLDMPVFEERGKPEYPERTSLSKGENQQQTHIWRRRRHLNPGHIGRRRVLSPMRHPCSRCSYLSQQVINLYMLFIQGSYRSVEPTMFQNLRLNLLLLELSELEQTAAQSTGPSLWSFTTKVQKRPVLGIPDTNLLLTVLGPW